MHVSFELSCTIWLSLQLDLHTCRIGHHGKRDVTVTSFHCNSEKVSGQQMIFVQQSLHLIRVGGQGLLVFQEKQWEYARCTQKEVPGFC